MRLCLLPVLFISLVHAALAQENSQQPPEGGYLKREYSLSKPYSGNGMTMQYWDFRDNAIITNNYIRLTSNHQGQRGAIWNKVPCLVRDWEMRVNFKVYGGGRTLAADGLALWYTRTKMAPGPVFGNRDQFEGLGVFLDTYKNGEHAVTFPQISAMVGNGSTNYDHLNDGKSNSIGSCLGSFRNKEFDTVIAISYVKERLTVKLDIDGLDHWRECFSVSGVKLPTGFFLGASAATGDLADNHHILSIKFYQLDVERTPEEAAEDRSMIKPGLSGPLPIVEADEDNGSSMSGFTLFMVVFAILVIVGGLAVVGVIVWQKRQEQNRKRFY